MWNIVYEKYNDISPNKCCIGKLVFGMFAPIHNVPCNKEKKSKAVKYKIEN